MKKIKILFFVIFISHSCSNKNNNADSSLIVEKDNSVLPSNSDRIEKPLLPIKQIIALAQNHFSTYNKKLVSEYTTIGLNNAYTGDFTNDGKEDVVIYYSIEPTNGGNYLAGQGLALYKNNGDSVSLITSYTPDYLFSFDKVSGGNIFISKEEYTEDDPRCCPSIHKQIELTVNGEKIYERNIN